MCAFCFSFANKTHLNTFCSEVPDTVGQCRPAKMPPATLPNVFPAPEITEGSLLIKAPEIGNVSPALMDTTSFVRLSKEFFAISALVVEIDAFEIRGSSADDEVTDGLINAAIENSEVAWDECLRFKSVVDTDVELSEVGLMDLLLKLKESNV